MLLQSFNLLHGIKENMICTSKSIQFNLKLMCCWIVGEIKIQIIFFPRIAQVTMIDSHKKLILNKLLIADKIFF